MRAMFYEEVQWLVPVGSDEHEGDQCDGFSVMADVR